MKKCCFINHAAQNCGVYQYGKRLFDIISKSGANNYFYKEITRETEYVALLNNISYDTIIYNYHIDTMPWLNDSNIIKSQKNIAIMHEGGFKAVFDAYIDTDCTATHSGNTFSIPRPIFELPKDKIIHSWKVPFIGSFGLALPQKGFENLIRLVNSQFESACINLHIPNSEFGDPTCLLRNSIIDKCKSIPLKEDITLFITHGFMSDNTLLDWLSDNTINIFNYDSMNSRGLSSAIDYAISVNRPIGISSSNVFRHIYSDSICVDKVPIKTIIENGCASLDEYRKLWSHKNLIQRFDAIVNSIT